MKKVFALATCVLILLSSCSPSPVQLTATAVVALQKTQTAAPTKTSTPTPKPLPTITATVSSQESCVPDKNIFKPLNPKDYAGEVDGSKLVKEVEKLTGSEVEVSGKVIESEYFYLPGEVDSTIVLINIMGSDGKTYEAMIELPDKGLSVKQYLSGTDIHAVGIVLGELPAPSPDFFKLNPNDGGKQYPLILAELASGGCKK